MKKSNIKTLAEYKNEYYGKQGTASRKKLEEGYVTFRIGALIQEARLEKGMTQAQLAKNAALLNHIFRGLKTT